MKVTFPAGSFGSYPGTGPIPGTDAVVEGSMQPAGRVSATVAQPLTGLHKAGLSVKASQITREMEKEQLRTQRAAVANDVRRLYYAALQAESATDAAREQMKALQEMSQVVTRYVSIETALPYESVEVDARLAAQRYQVMSLENAVASQKQQLNLLFGRDPRTPFELVSLKAAASVEESDLEAARQRALERRPELQRARLQVELADTDRRLKKADSIPQVNLALSYDSFVNMDLLPRNVAQVGLQVKWEPFDWGRKGKELAAKTLAVEQAGYAMRDQRNRVLAEVEYAFRHVQEARALVEARRLGHESSRERMRVALLRGRADSMLVRDVLQAQASAADARAQYDEAQLALWQARADLDKAMGEER